jgi:hypothetical protein
MSGERITDHLSVVLSPFLLRTCVEQVSNLFHACSLFQGVATRHERLLSFLPPCSPVVQSSYFSPPILKRSPAEKFSRYAG